MFKRQDGARAVAVVAALLAVPAGAAAQTKPSAPPAKAAAPRAPQAERTATPANTAGRPTVEEARKFVEDAETRLNDLDVRASRADWVHNTFITDDTEVLSAQANESLVAARVELAKAATRFDGLTLPEDVARKLTLLKTAMTLSAPADPREAAELTRIVAGMEGTY